MELRKHSTALVTAALLGLGLPQPAASAPADIRAPAPEAAEIAPERFLLAQGAAREQRIEDRLGLSFRDRRRIQAELTILGYNPRGIDGIFGPRTRRAIAQFQADLGRPATGYLRPRQVERLSELAQERRRELKAEAERARRQAEREDNAYWAATGKSGLPKDLRSYLRRYPDGLHADAARAQLDAIERDRRRQARQEERQAWEAAVAEDRIGAYRRYLETYPSGIFADTAAARIEDLREETQRDAARERRLETERALELSQDSRRSVEDRLNALGFRVGPIDGVIDRETRLAIRGFQRTRGLNVTGFLNEGTLRRLVAETS